MTEITIARTVVEWIAYDDAKEREESVGGLGGWFGYVKGTNEMAGHRWADYIEGWKPAPVPYLEAIRDSVLAEDRFISGQQHQGDDGGIPLFDDGTVALFSYRGWGDLMAAIATIKDGQDHGYMEFYC